MGRAISLLTLPVVHVELKAMEVRTMIFYRTDKCGTLYACVLEKKRYSQAIFRTVRLKDKLVISGSVVVRVVYKKDPVVLDVQIDGKIHRKNGETFALIAGDRFEAMVKDLMIEIKDGELDCSEIQVRQKEYK